MVFGNNPVDEPQTIHVDGAHRISRIIMEATGDRNYTLQGSVIRFDQPTGFGQLRIDVDAGATANLAFENRILLDHLEHVFRNDSSSTRLNFDNQVARATGHDRRVRLEGSGEMWFNHKSSDAGFYRQLTLTDNLNLYTDTDNQQIVGDNLTNITHVLGANINLSLISNLSFTGEGLATASHGLRFYNDSELKVRAAGGDADDRVLTTQGPNLYAANQTTGIIRIVDNEVGTSGDFILRMTGNHEHEVPVATRAGSRVEVINDDFAAFIHKVDTDPMVISGAGGLRKAGSGILDIQTAQTYTGTTAVDAGTLLVNGSLHADSTVTVADGATLGGSGSMGDVLLLAGATLSPGNSIGTLTVNELSLNGDAALIFELGAPSDPYDQVVVMDDLLLAGTLNIVNAGGMAAGTYTLFTYAGNLTDNGLSFGSMPGDFTYNLNLDTPGEINLQVIPEPAALWLVLACLTALVWHRRAKRSL